MIVLGRGIDLTQWECSIDPQASGRFLIRPKSLDSGGGC